MRRARPPRLLPLVALCLLVAAVPAAAPLAAEGAPAALSPTPAADGERLRQLIGALRSRDDKVRAAAARAVGRTKDPRAVDPLLELLQDKNRDVVNQAAAALGEIGDPRAAAPLVVGVRSGKLFCPDEALVALGPAAAAALLREPDVESRLKDCRAKALTAMGGAAVESVVAALGDPREEVRATAASILTGIADGRAVAPLIALLGDPSANVRGTAAQALGPQKDQRAVPPLAAILERVGRATAGQPAPVEPAGGRDLSPEERARVEDTALASNAARALGRIGGDAVEALLKAAAAGGPALAAVAEALGESGDPRAVEPLAALLQSRQPYLPQVAANALGRLGDPRAADALLAALQDGAPEVRSTAARALAGFKLERAAMPILAWYRSEGNYFRPDDPLQLAMVGPSVVDPLIEALSDARPQVRQFAASALGRIGDRRALEPLLEALLDASSQVRATAVEALAAAGDPRGFYPLLDALRDPEQTVVSAAAAGLGRGGDPRAVQALVELAREPRLAMYATEALARMKTPEAVEALVGLFDQGVTNGSSAVIDALAGLGAAAVPPLAASLARGERGGYVVEQVLAKIGEPAVGPLSELVKSQRPETRVKALQVLGRIKSPAAVAVLTDALRSPDAGVAPVAAEALGNQGELGVEPLLAMFVGKKGFPGVHQAMEALGRIGDARAIGPLVDLLVSYKAPEQSGDVSRTLARIDPLWMLGDAAGAAAEAAVADLSSPDASKRRDAASLLVSLRVPGSAGALLAALQDKDAPVRLRAAEALGWMDAALLESATAASVVDGLTAALRKGGEEERVKSGRALSRLDTPQSTAALLAALGDPQAPTRYAAATALSESHRDGKEALEPLLPLTADADPKVRQAAVNALSQIDYNWRNRPAALAMAREATAGLQDPDPRKRAQAVEAVAGVAGAGAYEALAGALRDPDETVRMKAAQALRAVRDPKALDPVFPLLADADPGIRAAAATALQTQHDDRCFAAFLALLEDPDERVRRLAVQGLGALGDDRAVTALVATLKHRDPGTRVEAARALRSFRDPRIVEPLIAALGGKDWQLQQEAAATLAQSFPDWSSRPGGEQAVAGFIEALRDPEPQKRYRAVFLLGSTRSRKAVGPLIEALSDSDRMVSGNVAPALTRITGVNLGSDPTAWRVWWERNKGR